MTAVIFGPELLLVVVVAFVALTIWALVRAFSNQDVGWGVGIIVAWLFGLGWLVAAIYLFTHRART